MSELISPCCQAPVRISGKGMTHWYECVKCGRDCDPVPRETIEDKMSQRPSYDFAPRYLTSDGREVVDPTPPLPRETADPTISNSDIELRISPDADSISRMLKMPKEFASSESWREGRLYVIVRRSDQTWELIEIGNSLRAENSAEETS